MAESECLHVTSSTKLLPREPAAARSSLSPHLRPGNLNLLDSSTFSPAMSMQVAALKFQVEAT